MATQNTQVCCCGATAGTSVIAWFQIVVAVFGIVGVSVVLADMDEPSSVYEFVNKRRRQRKIVMISLLVFALVSLVLGILLLIGNKREKIRLLWAWLIITAIGAVLGLIFGIVSVPAGEVSGLVFTLVFAAISGFMIYIVHRRIQDIKLGSAGLSSGA